ncbi:MAG TPA: hypothetical protein VNH83_11110 [Bryobacteraceae bacterium]|nr:hypothetical protein [Bryobacteraceae bacterium]
MTIDAEYCVPGTIELEGESLIWNWTGQEKPINQFDGLLDGFVNLHDGPPEGILAYARRWGTLWGCPEHNRPEKARLTASAFPSFCLDKHPRGHREPLAAWQAASRQFSATLRIAYDLATGRRGAIDAWKSFYNLKKVLHAGKTVADDRADLLKHLNRLLFASGVRPQILWRNEGYAIDFLVESLHAALVAQTTLLIAQRGIAICASCGRLFPPKQLKSGSHAYCNRPQCGRGAAVRAAQRRRYQKKLAKPAPPNVP